MNTLILSAISGVLMMFSGFFIKSNRGIRIFATVLMMVLIAANLLEMRGNSFFPVNTEGMMSFDGYALLFVMVALVCTLAYFLLSAGDMEKVGRNYSDYFALIFFIICGIVLTSSFRSLLILFLGIEIISIPLYILAGSEKSNLKSNEASLKYFLMGAFSTGIMLMGIALIYGAEGTFDTAKIGAVKNIASAQDVNQAAAMKLKEITEAPALLIAGLMMLLFSMSFKVSAAPFHFWTPDVYDGTPTVFTSFMATVVKAAGFIAFMRLFEGAFGDIAPTWKMLVGIIVAATLFIGNITAVFQQSVKRMLAYSSIAQAGFMMMAVYALNSDAREGLILYTAAYSLATIGIFAVLMRMPDHSFDAFNGFARSQPVLAGTLVIFVLSLAGIPLTAGFLSKFYMLKATMEAGSVGIAIFAVLMAAISVYYYFRLLQAMYFRTGPVVAIEASMGFRTVLISLAVITILLGIFPGMLTGLIYF